MNANEKSSLCCRHLLQPLYLNNLRAFLKDVSEEGSRGGRHHAGDNASAPDQPIISAMYQQREMAAKQEEIQ
jgi:hypothetical protein